MPPPGYPTEAGALRSRQPPGSTAAVARICLSPGLACLATAEELSGGLSAAAAQGHQPPAGLSHALAPPCAFTVHSSTAAAFCTCFLLAEEDRKTPLSLSLPAPGLHSAAKGKAPRRQQRDQGRQGCHTGRFGQSTLNSKRTTVLQHTAGTPNMLLALLVPVGVARVLGLAWPWEGRVGESIYLLVCLLWFLAQRNAVEGFGQHDREGGKGRGDAAHLQYLPPR